VFEAPTNLQRKSTDAAAAHLGISSRTLEKWRLTGDGPPYIKLGRRVVYDLQDLDAWAVARRRQSTSDAP
jgi:hypothetical protein